MVDVFGDSCAGILCFGFNALNSDIINGSRATIGTKNLKPEVEAVFVSLQGEETDSLGFGVIEVYIDRPDSYLECDDYPFRTFTEQDVSVFLAVFFLGAFV